MAEKPVWRWVHNMITEKDIRNLRRHQTTMGKVYSWFLVVIPFFVFIMGVLNLELASKIGGRAGYSLANLCQNWIAGVDVSAEYSGIHVKAMEMLSTAALHFGLTLVFSIAAYAHHKTRKLNTRILETLNREVWEKGHVLK